MLNHRSTEAYGAFAYAYDKALGARFFRAVWRLIEEELERHPTPKRTHLDLACGTGLAIEAFRARGWKSVGVDASPAMLELARKRAPRIVAADIRALPLRTRFARVTCLYDSLNHLLEPNDLVAAFRAARAAMDHDALFLFDMNHAEVYPTVWGGSDPFVAKGPDYHLEIATSYRARERTAKAIVTGWAEFGGHRVAIREQRRQRAYSEREIVSALADARLEPVDIIDFDPYESAEAGEPPVKLFFVARPVGG